MVNKVIVAAAGRGTRMLHLTDEKPKHLIEVNGKPFLFYVLENLSRAGYEEVVLVAGYKKDLMDKFIKKNIPEGIGNLKISFIINQYEELNPEEKYGTACPLMLKEVRNFVGNEQFLFISGDNLYSVGDLRAMNIHDGYNYVAGIKHENPEKYGVLIKDGGDFLDKIIEKPKDFVGDVINAGLYKFTPEVFDKIFQIKKSTRGEYEITDAISLLAGEKKVKIKSIKDYWHDFGSPEDIKKLSNFLKSENNKGE
jgi:bifunctional UDP-N-acetylglucosamine pyrophosphorylase/glucosamine-1-phosphate N-acetyltransferase